MSFVNHRDTDQSSVDSKAFVGVKVTETYQPGRKIADGEYRLAASPKYLLWVASKRLVTLAILAT